MREKYPWEMARYKNEEKKSDRILMENRTASLIDQHSYCLQIGYIRRIFILIKVLPIHFREFFENAFCREENLLQNNYPLNKCTRIMIPSFDNIRRDEFLPHPLILPSRCLLAHLGPTQIFHLEAIDCGESLDPPSSRNTQTDSS